MPDVRAGGNRGRTSAARRREYACPTSNEPKPPTSLIAAVFVGGIPLLMGAAAMYFTSGVVVSCAREATGQVTCTEGRRIFKLVDVPLRRFPDVRGAVTEHRRAYDEDGDAYQKAVPVLLTAAGPRELLPYGAGADVDVAAQVEAFARHPRPEGLDLGHQPGGMLFFFHLFGAFFVYVGLWNVGSYVAHVLRRARGVS